MRGGADFNEPELVAKEAQRGVEIANPQHGMKVSHDGPFGLGGTCSRSLAGGRAQAQLSKQDSGANRNLLRGCQYMIAADIETGIARLRDLVDAAEVTGPFTAAGICTDYA